jgi:hypothetical protein
MSCSNLGRVEDRVSLKWNYEYSSDVIHAVLISNEVSETNSGACKVHYSTFEVIESFKGRFQKGDKFKASGIEAHEVTNEGSEQFLLLKPYVAKAYPGYGDCLNEDYSDYLVIHNWCCSIDTSGERSLIMYDMLNSEQASENYLVSTKAVFENLRQLNSSSNK